MIRTILLHTVVAALLLPTLSTGASARDFGGFKPGYRFTLRVEEVSSLEVTRSFGSETTRKAAIPDGLPKFRKGQKVRFRIGSRGKLILEGASIPFLKEAGRSNLYKRTEPMSVAVTDEAKVIKTRTIKAKAVFLEFTRLSGGPGNTATYRLSYTLR